MLLEPDEKALEIAGAPAKQRIREDHKQHATARIKPLLAHIADWVFHPELTVKTLMRDCGVRDNTMASLFARDLGTTPSAYIRELRMETAARLLIDTDLTVWKVAHLIGFGSGNAFSRAFETWSGSRPTVYRTASRAAAEETETLEHKLREVARAILRGETAALDAGDRARLIDYLRAFDEAPPVTLAMDGSRLERGMALAYWEDLWHLPAAEQQALARRPYGLRTSALFQVLLEKSREAGRKDRQEGVQLVETALASLEGIAVHLTPDELANLQAQGYAWLANALRLALEYPKAKRTFAKARAQLPAEPDPYVLAEIYDLEGELLLFQSQLDEALKLKNRAVELFRPLGNTEGLAKVLISRAWTLGRARGYEAAIPGLLEALDRLDPLTQPYLSWNARQLLMAVYALCGQGQQALEMFPEARRLCRRLADPILFHHLDWTDSFIRYSHGDSEAAKKSALKARQGYLSLGETQYVAMIALDLAELCLELGRSAEAVSYAAEAIPIFQSFEIQPEAGTGLALLQEAAIKDRITLEAIREIRTYLGHLLQEQIGFQR